MGGYLLPCKSVGPEEGPALVFLPGFMGGTDDWDAMLPAFSHRYRCISINLNALGRHGPDACRMECAAESVIRTLDTMGIREAVLVGYSMGGRLALYLTLLAQGRWSRVLLESASPGLSSAKERALRRENDEAVARRIEVIARNSPEWQAFLAWWYEQPVFAGLNDTPGILEPLMARRVRNDPVALAAVLRGLSTGAQPDLWGRLAEIGAPTLLVVGERDRKYRIVAEEMAERCPAMAIHVVSGSGHSVHLENPRGYTAVLKAFLGAD